MFSLTRKKSNYKWVTEKFPSAWKLNNTFLSNPWVKFQKKFYFIFFTFSWFFFPLIFIVVQVQLSPCSPQHTPSPTHPTSHSRSYPCLALSMCPLYLFPDDPYPFSPVIHSHLPSAYCQCVLYFHVCGYILLACLFCWLGSTFGWDHMAFVFHRLAYFT